VGKGRIAKGGTGAIGKHGRGTHCSGGTVLEQEVKTRQKRGGKETGRDQRSIEEREEISYDENMGETDLRVAESGPQAWSDPAKKVEGGKTVIAAREFKKQTSGRGLA